MKKKSQTLYGLASLVALLSAIFVFAAIFDNSLPDYARAACGAFLLASAYIYYSDNKD